MDFAAVVRQSQDFDQAIQYSSCPLPTPGTDELLLKVEASAICRTDLQLASGYLAAHRLPIVPGHQVVGRVTKVGAEVTGWQVDDLAGLTWLAGACGTCRFCRRGKENLCPSAQFTGWDRDGGFASHVIAKADFAHSLEELDGQVEPAAIAPLLCGGVIGYRSLCVAELGPECQGAAVGFYGFGASATLAVQVAASWGIDTYVVTRSAEEVQRALALGVSWAGTYEQRPPVALDAAITFAPAAKVVRRALQDCDRGGIVAINAIALDDLGPIPYQELWWERSLRSVANVTRADVTGFLSIVASGQVHTQYEKVAFSEIPLALQRLDNGQVRGAFVIDFSG